MTTLKLILHLLGQRHNPASILVTLALRRSLRGCNIVLDVGCGFSPVLRDIGIPFTHGLEGYRPDYERSVQLQTHHALTLGDAQHISRLFSPSSFDACVALDVIEHLNPSDGLKLIADMERIARKRVVIFTPNGFLAQHHAQSGDLQEHLSGWTAEQMRGLGYTVSGLLGPKSMRGEQHQLRRPKPVWAVVSLLAQLWTKPENSAALFCVK